MKNGAVKCKRNTMASIDRWIIDGWVYNTKKEGTFHTVPMQELSSDVELFDLRIVGSDSVSVEKEANIITPRRQ